jgi:hypothetical protein
MRASFTLAALLLALQARADCKPAAAGAIAEAERTASKAERKADEAESVAVRSGNPGAARRAELARREADEARRRAAALACQPLPAATGDRPRSPPSY